MITSRERRRPISVLAAVVLSGALLTGCGGGDDPVAQAPAVTLAPPAKAPQGYRVAKVVDHSFQIAYPKGWSQLPIDPAKIRQAVKDNPQLPLDPSKPLPYQFLAYDPDGSGANVNVLASPAAGTDLATLEANYADQLKSLNPKDVKVERVQGPYGELLRASFSTVVNNPQGKITTKAVQFVLIHDNSMFIATISQVAPNVSVKTADQIGRSLYPL